MTERNEYETELALHNALLNDMRDALPERALRTRVSPDLLRPWLEEYIRADETLRRGRLVTDLLRLGSAIWPACAKLLKGGIDVDTERLVRDARGPFGLHVILQNVGSQPLDLETHARRVIVKASDIGEPRRWHDRPQRTTVAPGDTIDLSLHYAVVALRQHGWRSHRPEQWESSSAIPQRETLIEVAYACDSLGVDSRTHGETKRRKTG